MKRLLRRLRAASLAAAAAAVLVAAPGGAAQDGWRAKPFTQWTKEEAEQVLIDSPWAQTPARTGAAIVGRLSAPDPAFNIRLRSALPVRQAMLRLRQLREKYDQLGAAKKTEFDEKNKPLVECPACVESYVVAIYPPPGGRERLPRALTTTAPEKIKLAVYLADERGARRALVHYVPPKSPSGEAVFFFERFDEKGAPLLTPATKKLVLHLGPEALGGDTAINRFEFDVAKMIVDGKVEF